MINNMLALAASVATGVIISYYSTYVIQTVVGLIIHNAAWLHAISFIVQALGTIGLIVFIYKTIVK